MPELTGTKDLWSHLRALWRWKWLFLFFLIAAPVVAYLMEHGTPKVYKSSALVGVNQTTVNTSLLNNSGSFSTSNVTAIAQLVTTTPVADVAAGLLNPPGNPSQIAGEVSASGDPATNFLTITAEDHDPNRAGAIANAFAKAISLNLQQAAIGQIDGTIKGIRAQLSHLSSSDSTTRPQLQQELDQLLASRSTQGSEAAILQAAGPGTLASTSLRRSLELALVIGLLLGVGAVVLAESSDRRLRTPEDLEGFTDVPLLAAIEQSAFSRDLTTGKEDDEAFQMLRTALMYFNVEGRMDSVLITSAGEKEGKTTIATRLALASARSGLNVILVDADLRRAQVSAKLGIRTDGGLGALIVGAKPLHEVLVDYPLEEPGAGRLRVVPSGPPPPNPSALMSSESMQRILRELESQSDLVIIDTPAALAVSDPVPLMRSVSGIVIVARMNRSSRQTIRRLQKIIEAAHGNVLGVVATGATSGPGYGHYYPKYYAQNGSNGAGAHGRLRRRRAKQAPSSKPSYGSSEEAAATRPDE
jgi:capsular exopolysaccharide synthesis family protein